MNDGMDAFPLDDTETVDDAFGTGNNAEPDDDNDGLTATVKRRWRQSPACRRLPVNDKMR